MNKRREEKENQNMKKVEVERRCRVIDVDEGKRRKIRQGKKWRRWRRRDGLT